VKQIVKIYQSNEKQIIIMQNQIGYYSLGKAGRPNEDRFRLLGGGFLPQDQKYTGFQDSGRGEIYAVIDGDCDRGVLNDE
jgi:hypothetical protein